MFYDKKDFQIQHTQEPKQKIATPKPNSKPPKVLKEAAGNVFSNPTPDILDDQVANLVLKDLMICKDNNNKNDAVEQLLNQHKIRHQSPRLEPSNPRDLNQSITARLAQVEKLNQNLKLELKEKYAQITELREKVQEQQKYISNDKSNFIEQLQAEKEENIKLKQKIIEMELYLNKYGVKWSNKDSKDAENKMKQMVSDISQPKPLFNYQLPKEISIEVMIRRIQELNYIMEKDGANQIVKNANGMHQFQKMESLPIGFYKNGIAMKGFKFFSYGSNDAYQILADIMDGYFPYQLKKQYPNGTLLKLIDKTEELYEAEKQNQVDMKSNDERQLKPQKKEEFLQQLPEHVIKNGKIIPIRSEVAKQFNQKQEILEGCRLLEGNWIVDTEAQIKLDQGIQLENVCTLKFRTETGKYTIIALMFSNQTVKEMFQTVAHLRELKNKEVEIILNFPRTTFVAEDATTLEDAGLVPSAQLFFK